MTISPSDIMLTGRVAVVTGGGAGIGRGIAEALAAFGAKVAIWERDPETSSATAQELGVLGVLADVRDGEQVDAALAETTEALGPVDILINNAGGVFPSALLQTSENALDAMYRANLRHVLLCTQRVARQMVTDGRPGSVISLTSIEGARAAPGYAAYAAAKAGVINYTRTAAVELAPHGIRVNAIAPDITVTEGLLRMSPQGMPAALSQAVPMGRLGAVEEVAAAAVFLASDMSGYITGQTIHVDGGTQAAAGWYQDQQTGEFTFGPNR